MPCLRKCLYSGSGGKYVTLKKLEEITTEAMDLVQEVTTKSVIDEHDGNHDDYSRTVPETTRLFTVIIATSTVAFLLIVAIAVACAFHTKKQKLMRSQSVTADSETVSAEKTNKIQHVQVECADKEPENVTCCGLLCCISESTKQPAREEHIYSEVDCTPTSITIVPETTEGIYDTIDGKEWRVSRIETKKIPPKPLQLYPDSLQPLHFNSDVLKDPLNFKPEFHKGQHKINLNSESFQDQYLSKLNPDCLQHQVIYSHLTATKPDVNPEVDASMDLTVRATQSQANKQLNGMSSDYDHLDYSPKTPPTQLTSVYTFDVSENDNSVQYSPTTHSPIAHSPTIHSPIAHSPNTHSPIAHSPTIHSLAAHNQSAYSPVLHSPTAHSPLFVIKDDPSMEQTGNKRHDYFVLESQTELASRQNSSSSTEVVVLNPSPASQVGRVFRFPSEQITSHEYFIVEPSSASIPDTIARPPLPPRNPSFRTSLHGDRYVSSINELGTNSRFKDDCSKERGKLFDRSFSFESSLVADAADKRESNEITIVHKPSNPVPVKPEVVPIRTAKTLKDNWFISEPQTNHVSTFGTCNDSRPSSTGDDQTMVTCNGARPNSACESQTTLNTDRNLSDTNDGFTVELRDRALRHACKSDIRRPLSFSSNEYIRRALRPKPFFQKFQHYDSASLVHRELLDIVNGYGTRRSSTDSNCETLSHAC